ncbi:MAG TPA: Ppx/GppA family phosphatase [Azospirillaceae bacterium]|nr:Ppx/GppA family phosphatase [Azospirillaceae bacterium]
MPLAFEHPAFAGAGRPDRVAVIDIGSNSIRLVVYDALTRAPFPIFNEKIMCGLGRTVERTGHLNPDGVKLALANLERFGHLVRGMHVARVDVLATAAVRDADDGPAFVAEVERRTGLTVRVISGEEEARLSAQGVLSGTPGADGLMGDLGGGSLELVGLERGVIGPQVTLPLGPFRLIDAAGGRQAAAVKIIDQHLEKLSWLAGHRGRAFFPVGGNWRALAKLHMEHVRHPLHVIHHYEIAGPMARDFAALVARQSKGSLDRMGGGSRRRNDTLPFAALVMERLIRMVQPSSVVFSAYGLREGHLFDLLSPEEQRHDPLIASCEELAARQGRFGTAEILVSWTAGLFGGEDQGAACLRHAACLLSDLGWVEHPDYRAEHAFLRILRLPFAGLDHAERAFLALALHTRYGGRLDDGLTAPARGLVREGQAIKANILGLALRLAHTLTGGVMTLLQRTSLRLDEDRLILVLPEDEASLKGEMVERRLESLAKALSRTAEIQTRG